jgi:hypothetical protein
MRLRSDRGLSQVIGYADKPGKIQALADVQAAAVTTDLAEITTALRDTPRPALMPELSRI